MNDLDIRHRACAITPHKRRSVDRTPHSQMVRKSQGARLLANNGHLTAPVATEIACLQGVVADIPDN